MPPVPFPFPFKVGTDICSVQRIFRIIAEQSRSRPSGFVRRILTPKEREAKGEAISQSLERWGLLQKKRKQLGAGIKRYPSNSAQEHAIHAGPFISAKKQNGRKSMSEDFRARNFEDGEAEDGNDLQEGMPIGNLKDAASVNAAEIESLKEPSIATGGVFIPEGPITSVPEKAAVDQETRESEHVAAAVAAEINAGEEAKFITKHEEQEREGLSVSSQLDRVEEDMERLYPEMLDISQFLAGRFAAKEAVIKAYEKRRLTYHDIQILPPRSQNGTSQKPITMVISELGDWDNAQIVPISISHDGGFAVAMCLAYEENRGAVFETADDAMEH